MILVTGGTGFVGAHLLYHLVKRNENIRAIYRSKEKIERVKEVFSLYAADDEMLISNIEWFEADITDVPAMIPAFKGVKKVYHCAALVSFNPKDYREMRKVNIHGTAIIVNLSIDANVKKICFVSSIAAVGNSLKGNLISEECEWNPQEEHSGYSITKFGAEMEVWRASQEGVEVVIVNPGVILGSGFWDFGTSKLFSKIHKGFKYFTQGVTGFVGVKDVAEVMILLMESTIKNERFIVVAENKSFKEVLFLIAKGFKKSPPSIKITSWQTAILWRVAKMYAVFTRKKPLLSKHAAKSMHSVSKYSSKKIEEKLNFKFEKLENVIQRSCTHFIKNQ